MRTALVKARPVALTLHNDVSGGRAYYLLLLKQEGARRGAATEATCHLAAMAYEEGARHAITRHLTPTLGWWAASRAADRLAPTYTELRGFLIGELDAHELIACRVAVARIATNNKYRLTDDGRYVVGGERGWL